MKKTEIEKRSPLHLVKDPPPPGPSVETPWTPPAELCLDVEALHKSVMEAIAHGVWEQQSLERASCEEDRQDAEAIVRTKVILASLPFTCEKAAQAHQLTAHVYDIHPKKDLVNMPGLHETAHASIKPTEYNLRNTAWLVYHACKAMRLRPEVKFYVHARADKGDFGIFIHLPYDLLAQSPPLFAQ